MTLEQILDCDAATLEKMTESELHEHFKKYLNVTRPELASKTQSVTVVAAKMQMDPKKQAAFAALAEDGVDMEFLKKLQRMKKK